MRDDNEYRIETVADFLNVPEDRIEDCLKEFADFIELSRAMLQAASFMAQIMGIEDKSKIGAYTWIDDGKKEKTVRFQSPSEDNQQRKDEGG